MVKSGLSTGATTVVGRSGTVRRGGFTLIEVLAAMAVLVLLVLALTRMFVEAANITKRGMSALMRNSVGETAMDSILQDLDCMVVNERISCCKLADNVEGTFDSFYFIGTSGDQDDDMPYEYFKYYVKPKTVTNEQGATYRRYDLIKRRAIMAVGASHKFYALRSKDQAWWELFDKVGIDEDVIAENVVMFDIYCQDWLGNDFVTKQADYESNETNPPNIPPVAIDVMLVVTSPEAAVEGGMLLHAGEQKRGWEVMNRESTTLIGRAMPMMGPTQYRLQQRAADNPVTHYYDDTKD